MTKGPGHRPLIIMRWILLGLLLVAAAVVLRIYLGRDTEPPAPRALADDPAGPVESSDVVLAAEGFEYEVIDEGVTLFFIRASRMISDRQDRFVLEGVELRTEEESGGFYTITSDRAIYDLNSRDSSLEGSVVMTGPNGLELSGESFTLQRGGRILESTAPGVAYRLPGAYAGTANSVRLNLHLNNVVLDGRVVIDSPPGQDPPVHLTAAHMLYREEEALLRTEGGVVFTRGDDRLSSRRLSVSFGPTEGGIGDVRFVQGRWQVQGRLALDSGDDRAGTLKFAADRMGVAFDSTGERIENVVLESGDDPATIRLEDGAGLAQTLRSRSILVVFAEGKVSRLESFVPTVLEEALALPGAPALRRLCGDSLVVGVGRDGDLRQMVLEGSVDFRGAGLSASGDRLEDDSGDALRLLGAPARLLAGNHDVEAPEIVYSRRGGSLLAKGGVRATGLDRSGVELASSDESAPVLVTADRASWIEDPPEAEFSGKVRAWQGESFLLADNLTVLENGDRLEGEGSVKTVWHPQAGDPETRPPLEVNAGEFVYLRQERRLNYSTSVRAHEAGRTVQCDELELVMDAERGIESLFCEGDAVIEDPINGRTVRGSEALYTPTDGLVLIAGTPVVLSQRDGTEMEGRRLRYNLETGEVRILSEPRTSGPEAELADPVPPVDPAEPVDG